MDQPIYLVGKHDICTVLTHFFKSNNVLALPEPMSHLNNFLKEKTPQNSITIIILSSDHKIELPPAYIQGGRIASCLLLDTVEDANFCITLQKRLPLQKVANISILAQWNPHYIKLGTAWINALKTNSSIHVNNWMADKVGKSKVLDHLKKGAQVCIYLGHGRPQKIVGYHGISAQEISQLNNKNLITCPIACFLSFSCYHLHSNTQQASFGEILVKSNKVTTFFGSRIATDKILNTKLGEICLTQFIKKENITLSDWINNIGKEIYKIESSSLKSLWESYSLLGNPLQLIK